MNQTILQVKNLKVIYDKKLILDIPDLEFEAGMIYALVGPNGAGKTTLLRAMDLLEEPTEGEIYFDGQVVGKSSTNSLNIRRQMTLVMQNPVLFRTSVYKNVAYGLNVRRHDKNDIDKLVLATLEMVGLSGFEHRKVRELSAGEAQRVALARGLVLNPRIIFLDEPTANVDRRNAQTFEALIKKINAEKGTTIVFTTHDLSQAYRLTHRVISLLDGKLITSSPENILYGKIEKNDGQNFFISANPPVRLKVTDYGFECNGAYIDPKDVMVSYDPIQSDQWNCLPGNITSIHLENSNLRLTVNVGVEIVAIMDRDKFQMATDIFSKKLYAKFKVSNVHVF